MNKCPRGLITEIVAPADNSMQLDRKGYARLIERAMESGGAVFINSISAGETLQLPADIRNSIVSLAMEILEGKNILLAGISGKTIRETAANIGFLEEKAAGKKYPGEVFLVDAPLCYRGNRGLSGYYARLCADANRPFILLNDPSAVKRHLRRRNIRTNVLKKLSENPAVRGIAHNGAMARSMNYIRAARHRRDFCFYDADENNFLNSPGSGGVISIGANICPETWKQMVESSFCDDEKRKGSESYRLSLLQKREGLKELYFAYKEAPAALVKTALKDMGLIASDKTFGAEENLPESKKEEILSVVRQTI